MALDAQKVAHGWRDQVTVDSRKRRRPELLALGIGPDDGRALHVASVDRSGLFILYLDDDAIFTALPIQREAKPQQDTGTVSSRRNSSLLTVTVRPVAILPPVPRDLSYASSSAIFRLAGGLPWP